MAVTRKITTVCGCVFIADENGELIRTEYECDMHAPDGITGRKPEG